MINTYNLFTVQVHHGKFLIPIELHKKIIFYVENNISISDICFSNVKGYQNHGDFEGKKEIDKLLNEYFNNIHRLNLCHGWLNVLGNDSYNKPHSHVGNNVSHSAILYLSNENNIYFITFSLKNVKKKEFLML